MYEFGIPDACGVQIPRYGRPASQNENRGKAVMAFPQREMRDGAARAAPLLAGADWLCQRQCPVLRDDWGYQSTCQRTARAVMSSSNAPFSTPTFM